MRKLHALGWMSVMALAVLLAAGCAKKPSPSVMAPPSETPVVTQTPSSQEVPGVKEQGMTETPVTEAPATTQTSAAATSLQMIHFNFDKYTLTPAAMDILAKNAAYIKAHPGLKVRVEGYCDERGSDEYNLALGQRRAEAAKKYLVSLGIAPDRLSVISYGEEMPLDPRHNEEAWAKNRRDEFKPLQ